MYELYEPAYRERVNMTTFLAESLSRTKIDVTSYAIQEIMRGDGATARVQIEVVGQSPRGGAPYPSKVEEEWILVSGRWYKVYQPVALPYPASGGAGPVAK